MQQSHHGSDRRPHEVRVLGQQLVAAPKEAQPSGRWVGGIVVEIGEVDVWYLLEQASIALRRNGDNLGPDVRRSL